MKNDDRRFVDRLVDPQSREQTIGRWRLSRTGSFVAFGCLFLAVIISLAGGKPGMCGLLCGIAGLNFAVAVSTDLKIKVALLVDELTKT